MFGNDADPINHGRFGRETLRPSVVVTPVTANHPPPRQRGDLHTRSCSLAYAVIATLGFLFTAKKTA